MSIKKEIRLQPFATREISIVPTSWNPETRTFQITWSVGSKGLRYGYYESLSMAPEHVRMGRLQSGNSPFCDAHVSWSNRGVIGRILSAEIKDGVGTAEVYLMDAEKLESADSRDTIRKIEAGVLPNVSVGYNVHRYERQPEVEGEEYPTYLATDWEPVEVSSVPIGFDVDAVIRNKEGAGSPQVIEQHTTPIERSQEETGMDIEQIKKQAEADKAAAVETAEKAGRAAEKVRSNEIKGICLKLGVDDKFAQRMIDEDHSIDKVRELVIEEKSKQTSATEIQNANRAVVTAGEDSADKFRAGASDWLLQRSGGGVVATVEKHTGKKLEAGEFRGMSFMDIARESLERQGVRTKGMDKMKLVGLALTHRAGFNTTSDFPYILENALHKVLLGSYAMTPDTWSRFCKKGSVSDFRAHPRYRLGSFGRLDAVTEHGEFLNKSIPDAEKGSITAGTKGNIIGISRQAIINDDMGAFNDLAVRLGRAGKLSVEMDVYTLLALNSGLGPTVGAVPLFDAAHNNISTSAALSAANLDLDRVKMGSQTDPSGNEILDLKPAILLVPLSLGGQARIINQSQYDPDTVANKAQMKPNIVAGLFQDIVDTARLTGNRRYLFADPSIAPVIEVAFLDGNENPALESQEGFRMDGVEWKVRMDYGVGATDYRGAVTNAGG